MIGYALYGPDNDSHFGDDASPESRCPACGYIFDRTYISPTLKIRRRVYDFSHTYDYGHIVSRKFAEFCIRASYDELTLKPLEADPEFLLLSVASPPVPFNHARRGTRFEDQCSACGVFESVVGANPIFLNVSGLERDDGFFRTDLEFGSGNGKSPLIIVGPATKERLEKERFTGLTFEPVEGAV